MKKIVKLKIKEYAKDSFEKQFQKELSNFFKWLNNFDNLGYTKKGIKFYVDEYSKHFNKKS